MGLLVYEPRRGDPLLELRFFRSVPFSSASAMAVCAFAALGGFLFLNTLYLQEVRGLSALTAGLYTLPIAAMTLLFAPLSGRLVGRRGPRTSLLAGGLGLTLGAALLTGLGKSTPLASLFPAYFIFGIGFGMINPPITNTAVAGMPAAQAGVAAAVASTSRQVGSTLGVAIVGAVAAAGVGSVGRASCRQATRAGGSSPAAASPCSCSACSAPPHGPTRAPGERCRNSVAMNPARSRAEPERSRWRLGENVGGWLTKHIVIYL